MAAAAAPKLKQPKKAATAAASLATGSDGKKKRKRLVATASPAAPSAAAATGDDESIDRELDAIAPPTEYDVLPPPSKPTVAIAAAAAAGGELDDDSELDRIAPPTEFTVHRNKPAASAAANSTAAAVAGDAANGDVAKPRKKLKTGAAAASAAAPAKAESKSAIVSASPIASGVRRPALTGWEWWRSIGSPAYVCSPMVGQSELAFRQLVRKHGAQLCYTPMFISSVFAVSDSYRESVWQTCPTDRPLLVQFCGNDPATLLTCARMVQDSCDGIDLNLGCPQEVAKRGSYGAFLMDDLPLVRTIVTTLVKGCSVPVTCKIRIFNTFERTLEYARLLQSCGISMITVHGRQRHQKEEVMADWITVRRLKASLTIPVVCNGDLWHAEDVSVCRAVTGADGFMSAQGILHNPAIFEPLATADAAAAAADGKSESKATTASVIELAAAASKLASLAPYMRHRRALAATTAFSLSFSWTPRLAHASGAPVASSASSGAGAPAGGMGSSALSTPADVKRQFALATEYLTLCRRHPPAHGSIVRRHLFFILFDSFQANTDLFDALCKADSDKSYVTVTRALWQRAESGKTKRATAGALQPNGKPRALRRDGTIAPPPWPAGGGGMNESIGEGGMAGPPPTAAAAAAATAASPAAAAAGAKKKSNGAAPAAAAAAVKVNATAKPIGGAAPPRKKVPTLIVRSESEAQHAAAAASAKHRTPIVIPPRNKLKAKPTAPQR